MTPARLTSGSESDSQSSDEQASATTRSIMMTQVEGVVKLVKHEHPFERSQEIRISSNLPKSHCDTQALTVPVVDNDHSLTVATDSPLPVALVAPADNGMPVSGRPDSKTELKDHDHAPVTSTGTATWSRGKILRCAQAATANSITSNSTGKPADKLHKTLRGVGGPKPTASGKRRLNRDYSQPGKFRGVRFRGKGRYSAELKVKEERRWLGIFTTAEEAARAFDKAAFEVRGRAARLNFPELIEGAEANHWHHRPWNAGNMMDQDSEKKPEDGHVDDDIDGDAPPLPHHGKSADRQHVSFPSRDPRQPKTESSTCDFSASHTMAGSHAVTSTPPFPLISRILRPGPHTHPLSDRPSLWSDLDADPLSLQPPMLPTPDAVNTCSPRDADRSLRADAVARPNDLLGRSSSNTGNVNPLDPTKDLPDGCGAKFR